MEQNKKELVNNRIKLLIRVIAYNKIKTANYRFKHNLINLINGEFSRYFNILNDLEINVDEKLDILINDLIVLIKSSKCCKESELKDLELLLFNEEVNINLIEGYINKLYSITDTVFEYGDTRVFYTPGLEIKSLDFEEVEQSLKSNNEYKKVS